MPKKPFSFNQFDAANPTARLFEKIMRDAVDYTKEIDDVFDAIVLTEPTLASRDADAIINNRVKATTEKYSSNMTNHIFIVRILGPNSPHNFLPDPIDFYVTNDEECKKRYHNLLQLHTRVSAKGLNATSMPARGDQVQIKLKKSDYVYDTQWSRDYMGIVSQASYDSKVKKRLIENEAASSAFNSSNPTTKEAQEQQKIALQAAYLKLKDELEGSTGSTQILQQDVYAYLSNAFGDSPKYHNLILGIMANIDAESGYNPNIVASPDGPTRGESSIGLFQMNVGSKGSYGFPLPSMAVQLAGAKVPAALTVNGTNDNVPYFAGGLFLRSQSIEVITPDKFNGDKDSVRESYQALTDWKAQLDFAVGVVNKILPIPAEKIKDYKPTVWSSWFQVYFEQPAEIKSRTPPPIDPPTS